MWLVKPDWEYWWLIPLEGHKGKCWQLEIKIKISLAKRHLWNDWEVTDAQHWELGCYWDAPEPCDS